MIKETGEIKVFEAFAGYGGASFGLRKAEIRYKVVGYSEIHPNSCELYDLNHKDYSDERKVKNIKNYGDITKIDPKDLPDFDFFTGGFPCQAFSSAGKGLGEAETRGTLFYEIIRICEAKQPPLILLENVKGLLSARHQRTFAKIIGELERIVTCPF
ncbi:MAG: DNA (cytosine-5-)-methyltransferase [Candidatus Omnitrophica bacterium]|nr:DNA (cytosine-5-)-methyltransferase [Candidatus Omnitrophota bacterium]